MTERQAGAEAPHFTRELLGESLRYFRRDLEAAMSGEAKDDRARSRLQAARSFGLDKIAGDVIAAIDVALAELATKQWPGGLSVRFLALAGAIRAMAEAGASTSPNTAHADLTAVAKAMAQVEHAVRQHQS